MASEKPRIAVFAGPTATIMNSAPLVTSNLARRRHGLPQMTDSWGQPLAFDLLRPQQLARPVTIYVKQFSAHPLEADAARLYGPPDGYLDRDGVLHDAPTSPDDEPVYEIELRPEDGLVPLPYMARQADGSAWDGDCAGGTPSPDQCRQPFYPDASRIFEEIDRLGQDGSGRGNVLGAQADYSFFRVVPPGGYTQGLPAGLRTDEGEGDIPPEQLGRDFFPYRPPSLRREPARPLLAQLTNRVQRALGSGTFRGGLWLEGSPFVEETTYWLHLLIDTDVPIVGLASPDWPHGVVGAGGDRHLIDGVRYVVSDVWRDGQGRDRLGGVVIQAAQIFASREVQKADARPGGYVATGGHGGIIGAMGESGEPILSYLPERKHTFRSAVRLSQLPSTVQGYRRGEGGSLEPVDVAVRDAEGLLEGAAIPHVALVKHARYLAVDESGAPDAEIEILGRIEANLQNSPIAGFVLEGSSPYGAASTSIDAALRRATFSGMPVVRVSRGNAEGFVAHERVRLGIAGSNLTATKARLLLMACLLRFGALPAAKDPDHPTAEEVAAVNQALHAYQEVFDTH